MTDRLQRFPKLVLLAMDQLTLYFQATTSRVWAPRGRTPIVQVTPRRHCIHFYGALDLRTGRDIAVPAPAQSGDITAAFLCLLLMLFPTQPILLLLDRAGWHFGPAIREILADNPRLELVYLPPACPDLNPQEHVWDQARDAISHNHRYRHFDLLVSDFETYLNETPVETNFMQKYGPPVNPDMFI